MATPPYSPATGSGRESQTGELDLLPDCIKSRALQEALSRPKSVCHFLEVWWLLCGSLSARLQRRCPRRPPEGKQSPSTDHRVLWATPDEAPTATCAA